MEERQFTNHIQRAFDLKEIIRKWPYGILLHERMGCFIYMQENKKWTEKVWYAYGDYEKKKQKTRSSNHIEFQVIL